MTKIRVLLICLLLSTTVQAQSSPYQLDWGRDAAILGGSIGVALAASALDDSLTAPTREEIAGLDKSSINGFDRWATNFSSRSVSQVSDVLAVTAIATPAIMTLTHQRMRDDVVTIGTMYIETMILATFIPSFGKGTVKRYRPYAYNPDTPDDPMYTGETTRSFFSGHSTVAFASMSFLANTFSMYYPESRAAKYVWIGSMTLASSVALLRVFSGAHFPTDVLLGSAVGFGIGTLVPWLHETGITWDGGIPEGSTGLHLNLRYAMQL